MAWALLVRCLCWCLLSWLCSEAARLKSGTTLCTWYEAGGAGVCVCVCACVRVCAGVCWCLCVFWLLVACFCTMDFDARLIGWLIAGFCCALFRVPLHPTRTQFTVRSWRERQGKEIHTCSPTPSLAHSFTHSLTATDNILLFLHVIAVPGEKDGEQEDQSYGLYDSLEAADGGDGGYHDVPPNGDRLMCKLAG